MSRAKKGADGYYRLNFTYNGKKYSVRSKNKAELTRKMQVKLEELSSGVKQIGAGTTVKEWGEEWLRTYKTNVRTGSYERIERILRNHICPHIGLMKISTVRPLHLQQVLNLLADALARDTVNHVRQVMCEMFDQARRNGLVKVNPAEDLKTPVCRPPETHRAISAREREIILRTAKTHWAGPWVLMMLYAGLRPGETAALTGADIHDGRIWISKAIDARTNEVKGPKSKAGVRSVPIPAALQSALPAAGPFDLLFPQRDRTRERKPIPGRRQTQQSIKGMWASFTGAMAETEREMVAKLELPVLHEQLPPLVPYDLRHTYCTDLQRAGVPLNVARDLMGHSSIEITARIYTHTTDDVLTDAVEKMNALHGCQAGDMMVKTGDEKSDDMENPLNEKNRDSAV